jgi:hypothetical protein
MVYTRHAIRLLSCCALVALAVTEASGLAAQRAATMGRAVGAKDPVILTFATVGDSRQDPVSFDRTQADPHSGQLSAQDARWLQNTHAFSRALHEISRQHPEFLFFNGDMIMGYGRAGVPSGWADSAPTLENIESADVVQTMVQYAFWRGMVAPLMEAGTYVVPIAGNHEVQCNSAHQRDLYNQLPCTAGKHARVENEIAWARNMGDLILDESRFMTLFQERPAHFANAKPALDGESSDQSKLTYSFDFRGAHFAVINTDPVGGDPEGVGLDSHAPSNWLDADLAAAKARGLRHLFVFGHKPAYTYDTSGTGAVTQRGLDVDAVARDRFWSVIETYGATYFCGHQHVYQITQPHRRAYQVIVGSGGSPFDVAIGESSAHPATDRQYVWATVQIHQSGRVDLVAQGFSDRFGPTRVLQRVRLIP